MINIDVNIPEGKDTFLIILNKDKKIPNNFNFNEILIQQNPEPDLENDEFQLSPEYVY